MTAETEVIVIGAGQSGLAAARALQAHGIDPVVLEAGPEPAGSWPRHHDSLTLLLPGPGDSGMPGLDFPGDPSATRTATRLPPTCAATPPPSVPTSAPARR